MKNLMRFLAKFWPIIAIGFIECIVIFANFTPNTYLVGWDNLFPEFNFALNIKRSLSSVWQEYRGLGYEDGMSHAANIVHYAFLWFLSLALPTNLLRYAFTWIIHITGGIGMFYLTRHLFTKHREETTLISLAAALFYQYSFATVQMFYLPFELFIVHYAFLPWLILYAHKFLTTGKHSSLLIFALLSLLATPQAHVPTVFIVYALALGIFLISSLFSRIQYAWKRSLVIVLVTVLINSFWGIPFAASTLRNAKTIAESKNNQMASEDIFRKNQKYGGFTDTALMRSFSLDYVQFDHINGTQGYMFAPWKEFESTPWVRVIAWSLFAITCLGGYFIVKTRKKQEYFAVALFAFSFAVIGNDIPVIGIFSWILRTYIPFFANVFRFVFTKFFFVYAFAYSLLLANGIYMLTRLLRKHTMRTLTTGIICLCILAYSYPSFTGNFLFKNLRVDIPKEYFQTFSFFSKQDPNERIAVLPAPWYWSWTQYKWGVIGSGFQWFGIPQPILDRAFDPWSDKNEGFYFEVSQTLAALDKTGFEKLLDKYRITWLLIDTSIINGNNPLSLYLEQLITILENSPSLTPVKTYGSITLYRYSNPTISPVQISSGLQNILPPISISDLDSAFSKYGTYQSNTATAPDIYIPFRNLFTGRTQKEYAFTVKETSNDIRFTSPIPSVINGYTLFTDALGDNQLALVNPKTYGQKTSSVPQILLGSGNEKIQVASNSAIRIPSGQKNTEIEVRIPKISGALSFNSDTTNALIQPAKSCDSYNIGTYTHTEKTDESGKYLRLESASSSNCLTFPLTDLYQKSGYIVKITSRHINGKQVFVSVTDNQTKRTFFDVEIDKPADTKSFRDTYFIIPPRDPSGIGYTLSIDNISIGREKTINDIRKIEAYQIPFEFLGSIRFVRNGFITRTKEVDKQTRIQPIKTENVFHPHASYWSFPVFSDTAFSTLILNQTFNTGWHAYKINCQSSTFSCTFYKAFPFLFGKELPKHVIINNWANSWELPQGESTIVLFFIPQLLEWFGFLLLPIPFLMLFRKNR